MTRRAASLFPTLFLLCALAAPALAAPDLPTPALPENRHVLSQQAQDLRKTGNLVPFAPPQSVLAALFTADGGTPKAIYGPLLAYEKTRDCHTAWLIEAGELARFEALAAKKPGARGEFLLTLEEDCAGKVTHSVFSVSPGSTPEAWLSWRSSHHGPMTKAHSSTVPGLKKAVAAGLVLMAELRGISVNGQPVAGNLEDVLRAEGRITPVFDLQTGLRPGN
ncbi:MAG: hypothetical protein KKA55_13795 [Proteobacteria bacterium]|nr:hypothetical protein [Pseudomonadota bacterium]MBU1596593.1 hypothetical protein [Pseudomonadota bacterium]